MLRPGVKNVRVLANWIGGRFVQPAGLEFLENVNPFTQDVIGLVPQSTDIDVNNAVTSALTAFPAWSALSREKRAEYLINIAREIENNFEEFAIAESQDTGKPLALSRNLDISRSIHNFRFFADVLLQQEAKCFEQVAKHHIVHRPVGVVGLISPWNLPLYLLTWKIAPALASGCTIVAKPSELTPTTASLLAEASARAGLPAGVLNIVHGYGQGVGDPIVRHKDVHAVSFTGGTSTGALVATAAAPSFKKVSLELGGKNPAIVMKDADLDVAVKGVVRAGFLNSGQICLCGSRVLVHTDIYEDFLARMKDEVESLKCGNPADPSTDIGPVVSEAHLLKVRAAVDNAVSAGAKVITGGPGAGAGVMPAHGFFYPPTILTDVAQDATIVQEEVFGPVVTVQKFSTIGEALSMANGVKYGLAASIWTRALSSTELSQQPNNSDLETLALGLDCGMVWVNCWLLRDLRVPFGGTKCSGVGREGGEHSLEFFTETKSLCLAEPAAIPPMPSKMPSMAAPGSAASASVSSSAPVTSYFLKQAPSPVGAYVHARTAGGLLFLAGVGPRAPGTNAIPGGPIRDPTTGAPLNYDIEAQTRACIENVKTILEGSGSSLDKVVDVQCFLIDMDRDFKIFNKVYAEYFEGVSATRTTIAINALPTPIAVELKVIALP